MILRLLVFVVVFLFASHAYGQWTYRSITPPGQGRSVDVDVLILNYLGHSDGFFVYRAVLRNGRRGVIRLRRPVPYRSIISVPRWYLS